MPLAPYTTPALVRTAMGVSRQDLPDDKIDVSIHRTYLREKLGDISATLPDDLIAVLEMATPGPEETRLRDLGEMVSTYWVAYLLTTSAPLFAPKEVRDDRTSMTRVDDPFKDLRAQLDATLGFIQGKLRTAYLAVFPDAVVGQRYAQPRTSTNVPLGTDPVTG